MADQADSQQPVVLDLSGYPEELEYVLDHGFTRHIFPGVNPRTIEIEAPEWLFTRDLSELAQEKPGLSEEELEEWQKGPEFGELVANYLFDKAKEQVTGPLVPDRVRVIILDGDSDLTTHIEKALKGSFPNVFICDYEGEEITYLNSLPIDELSLAKPVLKALKEYRPPSRAYASNLASMTEAQVLRIKGIGKSALQNIKDALAEHGVQLPKE